MITILIIILRTKSIFWVSAQLLITSEKNFELSQIHANEGNPGLGLEQEVTATEHSECFCPEKWEGCHSSPCVDLKIDLFPLNFPLPTVFLGFDLISGHLWGLESSSTLGAWALLSPAACSRARGGWQLFLGKYFGKILLGGLWSSLHVFLQLQELCWCEAGPSRHGTVPAFPLV